MLGFLNTIAPWTWTAFGKHPVAGDYISAGDPLPVLNAFAIWVEKGYQSLKIAPSWSPFRFWAKGLKNKLILGSMYDSSDRIGRRFPLMIIGTGTVKQWEKNWDLLPGMCENSWGRIDYIACKRYLELQRLQRDITTIPPPSAKPDALTSSMDTLPSPGPLRPPMDDVLRRLNQNGSAMFYLETDHHTPPSLTSWRMHVLLKTAIGPVVPNAVFMTQAIDRLKMVVFTHPLAIDDFSSLIRSAESNG